MTKPRRCTELDTVAATCVREMSAAPCATVACAYRTPNGWQVDEGAFGVLAPGEADATPDTPFDLASLTKPISALTCARLVRCGLLDWHMPLGVPLRDVHGTPSACVPLAWLAAHRAGLDGHRPLYAPLERGEKIDRFQALRVAGEARRAECADQRCDGEEFPAVYSDLGYLLLGEAMARAAGSPLDALARREVLGPLGLRIGSARQWRQQDSRFDVHVAPTERVAWRGGVVRGAVHDENAWALGEDASCGHAGLFGTARDVAMLGTSILDASRDVRAGWLTADQVEPLIRKRQDSTWRAGFDGKSEAASSAGQRCSPDTFGHLGFTGTSMWIDPSVDIVVVLLTNRVHPTREGDAIKRARPIVHDALFTWAMNQRGA